MISDSGYLIYNYINMKVKHKLYTGICVGLCGAALILCFYSLATFHQAEINIEWTTASEVDLAGYNLYRALDMNGPSEKINATLLPPKGDFVRGATYRFEDDQVISGRVYYYQLESVDTNGMKTRLNTVEVKASNGAWATLLTALCLLTAGLSGIWISTRSLSEQKARQVE